MRVRDMVQADYEAADRMMRELNGLHVRERPDCYGETEHPYSREDFEKIVESGLCISIAAEEDGELTGICFAAVRQQEAGPEGVTAYLEALYVSGEARRRGVASRLFCEAERRAKRLGAERLDLMVWEFNRPALDFYESMGMKVQRYILEKRL